MLIPSPPSQTEARGGRQGLATVMDGRRDVREWRGGGWEYYKLPTPPPATCHGQPSSAVGDLWSRSLCHKKQGRVFLLSPLQIPSAPLIPCHHFSPCAFQKSSTLPSIIAFSAGFLSENIVSHSPDLTPKNWSRCLPMQSAEKCDLGTCGDGEGSCVGRQEEAEEKRDSRQVGEGRSGC